MQITTFTIPAMQDADHALTVARALEAVAGVDSVHLTVATNRARVGFNEGVASASQLHQAVMAAGFDVQTPNSGCCGGCGGG